MYVWTFVICTWCKLKLHWIHWARPGSPVGLVPPTCLSSRNSVETTQQFFHRMLWLLSDMQLGILRNFCVLVCWCGHTSTFGADVDIMEWTDLSKCLADFSWSQVIRVAVLWTRTGGQPWDSPKIKEEWIPLQERRLGPMVHPCSVEYPIIHWSHPQLVFDTKESLV